MKKNKNKKNIKTYESFKLNLKHEIEISYPMLYGIMTIELKDRLLKKGPRPIGIMNDGYIIMCETPEKFEKCKLEYIKGNKYNNETMAAIAYGPESQYGN